MWILVALSSYKIDYTATKTRQIGAQRAALEKGVGRVGFEHRPPGPEPDFDAHRES